ncbi:MAG: hypothetical protein R3B54_10650 [Bdellovibrionota bacterium]
MRSQFAKLVFYVHLLQDRDLLFPLIAETLPTAVCKSVDREEGAGGGSSGLDRFAAHWA